MGAAGWILLAAGAWLLFSLAMQACARHAERIGHAPAPACFHAPVVAPSDGPLRIAFLGDLQRGVSSVAPALPPALARLGAHLLVSSGDFVSHGEAPYYGVLCRALSRAGLATPARVVPGNHDLQPRRARDDAVGGAEFERCFGPRRWAMALDRVLLVGLDTEATVGVGAARAWLAETLAAHPGLPWICVAHRPPFRFDRDGAPPYSDLAPVHADLRRRPPILQVSGHLHAFSDRVVDGVRYVVNAHGGDVHGLDPGLHAFDLFEVRVHPDGRVETQRHPVARRRDWRAAWDQLCVRAWCDRRRPLGRVLALPGALLLRR